MKKLASKILAILIVFSCIHITAYGAEPAEAIALSSAFSYTNAASSSDAKLINLAKKVITSGQKRLDLPSSATEIAKLKLSESKTVEYQILQDNLSLYMKTGNEILEISATDFFALASSTANFYKFRSIPAAIFNDENKTTAAISSSNYSFKKLDNKFYKTQWNKNKVPALKLKPELTLPTISSTPTKATVNIISNGTNIFSGSLSQAKEYSPPQNKELEIKIDAVFDNASYKGNVSYSYLLSNSNSDEPSFEVSGSTTFPGELVVLRAHNLPTDQKITVNTDIDFKPVFYDDGSNGQIALMPVSYMTSTGSHYIELSANNTSQKYSITTNNKTFQIQNLTVGQSTTAQTIQSQKANTEFEEKFLSKRWDDSPSKLWDSRFIIPVQNARITTQFGAIRYTNGSKSSSRHGGVDMAAPTGTRVSATNSGKVVYAGLLQLTGYSVLIEHGYGLKSWHYHMNSINVKKGDLVEKGQKIGEVGTTGFSTGPHLHFAISVNNVFVNPYTLFNSDLLE